MGWLFYFFILQAKQILSYSLGYDASSHQYEDLLISISPDIPGEHFLLVLVSFLLVNHHICIKIVRYQKGWDCPKYQGLDYSGQSIKHCSLKTWNIIFREAYHYTLQVRDGLSSIRYENEEVGNRDEHVFCEHRFISWFPPLGPLLRVQRRPIKFMRMLI